MSTQATSENMQTYNELRPAAHLRSVGWFVRRAMIGILALTIFVTGGAWLLHASIEPEQNTAVTITTAND
ncbi:MAG TPA: hypothetical protein PK970_01300 [Hyphomicrobiaceae bacterium]|nr:hypothetical protein [Hyphomicrobiaceae bacterium]